MSESRRTALRQPDGTPDEVQGSGQIRMVTTSDGYPLHFRHWSVSRPLGVVVGLHGIQSHSGWYEYSSWRCAQAGYAVYFGDRRGSGLNAIDRGHADHGLRLINDVRQLIQLARSENPGLTDGETSGHSDSLNDAAGSRPLGVSESAVAQISTAQSVRVTLMGISWGGKIAAATAALFPEDVDQLALLYPGLEPRLSPTRVQRLQLRAARDFDVRRKWVTIPLRDPALFTSSPFWQSVIRRDPLALHSVTSGFLNSGRDLDQIVQKQPHRICQRLLLMQAGRDAIIDNLRTRHRVATFASSRMELLTYADACHTLEFEDQRDVVIDDLIEWLGRMG